MASKKLILCIILFLSFLFCVIPISAKTQFSFKFSDDGIIIKYPMITQGKLDNEKIFRMKPYNQTGGNMLDNTTTSCYMALTSRDGSYYYKKEMDYNSVEGYYISNISSGNFSEKGKYFYCFMCNNSYTAGFVEGQMIVTESGMEITEGRAILITGLQFLLVMFFFISLYSLFTVNDYRGKFALFWVSYLLITLISFLGWQTGVEGLIEGIALTGVYRIMFWVLIVGMFPLVLLSIAWMVYIHTLTDEVKNMMDKGMSPEEAYKKSARRKYY